MTMEWSQQKWTDKAVRHKYEPGLKVVTANTRMTKGDMHTRL